MGSSEHEDRRFPFFEEPSIFEELLSSSKNPPPSSKRPTSCEQPSYLRSSEPKIVESPRIYDIRSRKTKNPPIFTRRSSASKIEEPYSSAIFGAEEWVEDWTEDGGSDFFEDVLQSPGSGEQTSILYIRGQRAKIHLYLSLSRRQNEETPSSSFSNPDTNPRRVA